MHGQSGRVSGWLISSGHAVPPTAPERAAAAARTTGAATRLPTAPHVPAGPAATAGVPSRPRCAAPTASPTRARHATGDGRLPEPDERDRVSGWHVQQRHLRDDEPVRGEGLRGHEPVHGRQLQPRQWELYSRAEEQRFVQSAVRWDVCERELPGSEPVCGEGLRGHEPVHGRQLQPRQRELYSRAEEQRFVQSAVRWDVCERDLPGAEPCAGKECEDTNPCTDDSCNPANGNCVHAPKNSGSCSPPSGGTCVNGTCQAPNPCAGKECEDTNPCTDDSCNPANGNCVHAPKNSGSCSPPSGGTCVNGTCQAPDLCAGKECEDTNPCTNDSCNPANGNCVHSPRNSERKIHPRVEGVGMECVKRPILALAWNASTAGCAPAGIVVASTTGRAIDARPVPNPPARVSAA